MPQNLSKNMMKNYLFVFVAAFVVRLIYLFLVYKNTDSLLTNDSQIYIDLAITMLKTGGFNSEVGGIIFPATERVPIYPIFLAIHRLLFENYIFWSVISQLILDSFSCVVIAMIAAKVNRRVALLSGLVASLNPTLIIFGSFILTDSLFHFFICLFLLFLSRSLGSKNIREIFFLGLVTGLAILTRDFLLYWPLVFIPFLFLHDLRKNKKMLLSFSRTVLLSMTIILCISPLMIRNITKYGSFSLTSHTGNHALQWVLPLVWEVSDGIPWSKGSTEAMRLFLEDPTHRALVDQNSNPFALSQAKAQFTTKELLKINPFHIAQTWSLGVAMNLFAPSTPLIPFIFNTPHPSFYMTEGSSKMEKIKKYFLDNLNNTFQLTLIFSFLGVFVCRVFQSLGFFFWFQNRQNRFFFLMCLIWIGYILAINGPVATPKYRLPIEPVLSIYLAFGIDWLWHRRHKRAFTNSSKTG